MAVIDQDGSPQAARVFGLWNPSFVPPNEEGQGGGAAGVGAGNDGEEEAVALRKRSPYKDTARLLAAVVEQGLKTLVFVKVCVCGCVYLCICIRIYVYVYMCIRTRPGCYIRIHLCVYRPDCPVHV